LRFRTAASLLFEYCHFPCLRVERFLKKTKMETQNNGKEREKINKYAEPCGFGCRSQEHGKP
jgi:hypothetical protein